MPAVELANQIIARFVGLISVPVEFRGEVTLSLADANRIAEVCEFLKSSLGFDYLVDVTSLDNYGEDPRWTLVYHLYGYGHRSNLRIKTAVSEEQSELPSVSSV